MLSLGASGVLEELFQLNEFGGPMKLVIFIVDSTYQDI